MNRRNFLRGLVGSAVTLAAAPVLIDEFARVYSFPTNIVVAPPFTIGQYVDYANFSELVTAKCFMPFHAHRVYDKKFKANLRANTPFEAMSKRYSLPNAQGERVELPRDESEWFDDDDEY
jgi:hypothetical protein